MSFFSTRKFIVASLVLAFSLILFFTWYTYQNVKKEERKSMQVTEALAVLHIMEKLMDDMQDLETGQWGFIITGNLLFLQPYHSALANLKRDTLDLRMLALKYPRQSEDFNALQNMIRHKLDFAINSIDIKKSKGLDSATRNILSGQGRLIMDSIRVTILNIDNAERDLLKEANSEMEKAGKKSARLFLVLVALYFAIVIIFYLKIRRAGKNEINQEERMTYLARLVESSGDAIFSCTPDYKIITWNKAAEDLYGYTRQEASGQHFLELLKSRSDEEKRNEVRQSLLQTGTYKGEFEYTTKIGETLAILSTVGVIKDEKNSITGFVIVHRDITQKKELEDRLKKFNQELELQVSDKTKIVRDVFERVSDAIVALDTDWRYTYVNSKAELLFNKPHGYLTGKHIWTEFPDGVGQPFHKLYEEAMATQEYRYIEEYYPPFDRWFENHIYPSPTGLSIYFKDITERKKAEQQLAASEKSLRQILFGTAEIFYVIDTNHRITLMNKTAEANLQKAWGQPVKIGSNILEMIPPDEIVQAKRSLEKVFAGEKVEYELHLTIDELPAWVVVSFLPVLDDDKNIVGAYISSKDISAKKEAEVILKDSEEKRRLIMNAALDAIVSIDASGTIIFWNPQAEKIFGWKEDEIKGNLLSDTIIPQRYKESHKVGMARYFKTGEGPIINRLIELNAINKTGNEFPIELSIIPIVQEGVTTFTAFIRDITERKKAASELSLSVERFEAIATATHDALWEWNFETEELWANDMHQQLYGLKKTDPVPRVDEWKRRIHPEDFDKTISAREVALSSGFNYWESEYRFLNGDKQYITIYDRCYIVRDKEGKPIRLTGSMIDITQRKKNEEEVIKARNMADKMIDTLPGVFYFFDETGKFIRWNRQFELITGYTAEDIANMIPLDFFPAAEREYIFGRIQEVFEKGVSDAEANFLTKAGEKISYYFKAVLLNYEGKPCLLGSGIDISERKKSEEAIRVSEKKYKLLFENNPMPMWMLSLPEMNIIDVNEAAINHYGYSRAEFLKLNAVDLRPEEEVARFMSVTRDNTPGINYSGVWRHKKKDGSLIDMEIITHGINYDDKPARLVLANDVTEKLMSETLLKKSFEDIRQLTEHIQKVREEERTHIAREIHDELGQQLTVLKMDVSWLNKKMQADPAVAERLNELTRMLDGTVKTVRRISSELRPSLLDDLGLVATMDWHLKEFGKRTGIRTVFDEPDSIFTISENITTGLYRIFQESLTNVARHAEASKVYVSLVQTDDELLLKVQDNGKGFDKEKVANKRTLGILGMKERAEMMGGKYSISSEPGKGTTVVISISQPGASGN